MCQPLRFHVSKSPDSGLPGFFMSPHILNVSTAPLSCLEKSGFQPPRLFHVLTHPECVNRSTFMSRKVWIPTSPAFHVPTHPETALRSTFMSSRILSAGLSLPECVFQAQGLKLGVS